MPKRGPPACPQAWPRPRPHRCGRQTLITSEPQFCSPFSTLQEVHNLIGRHRAADAKAKVRDAEMLAAGKKLRRGVQIRESIRCIYRWKLQSFLHRFAWAKSFPDGISDEVPNDAVQVAQEATPSNEASVRTALSKLDEIRGVGIPVASAVLTALHPDQFTVIDRLAYRALGVTFRCGLAEYLRYLGFCRNEAARFGITLREHDEALWQYGAELSRKPSCDSPRSTARQRWRRSRKVGGNRSTS